MDRHMCPTKRSSHISKVAGSPHTSTTGKNHTRSICERTDWQRDGKTRLWPRQYHSAKVNRWVNMKWAGRCIREWKWENCHWFEKERLRAKCSICFQIGDDFVWIVFNNPKYRKFSNIRRTQFPNINLSRLVLQLSLPNPLKPCVKLRMKM